MITDITFKQKIMAGITSLLVALLGFFFKEPIISFLIRKIYVPIWIFPLIITVTIASLFLFRWVLLFRNKHLQEMRLLMKPGREFGILGGRDHVIAVEWSWLDPRILIAQTQDGHFIRVHYTTIIFYA